MSKKLNDNITVKANDTADCGTITGNNYFADNIKGRVDMGTSYTRNWGILYNIKKEENMMNLYEVYIIDTEKNGFDSAKVIAQKEHTAIHMAWEMCIFSEGNKRTLDDYKVETRVICSWAKKE